MTFIPEPGEWPCQTHPKEAPDRLVAFLYRALRDGLPSPGDIEQVAIDLRDTTEGTIYTNAHLEAYARSLATYLTT